MVAKTPRPKNNLQENDDEIDGESATLQDICLSPTPSWTPAPPALKLSEDNDDEEEDRSPTSVRSVLTTPSRQHFSFASPRTTTKRSQFWAATTPKSSTNIPYYPSKTSYYQTPKQHGYLSSEPRTSQRSKIFTLVLATIFWTYGASSLNTLHQKSYDPLPAVPPKNSPSALAQEAFAKNYARDWGAAPPLWVVLDASSMPSHSFTDDTSMVYYEGKHYHSGLTDYLLEKYSLNGNEETSAVRVTSYFSLQDHGLDYISRNMVTPDGSKTMLQIQYLPRELGDYGGGVEQLKESIVQYGRENLPSILNIHYTGPTWNPSTKQGGLYKMLMWAVLLSFSGVTLNAYLWGIEHPATLCGILSVLSIFTTMAFSSIILTHLLDSSMYTPLALSAMFMISVFLPIYYSKIQADSFIQCKTLGESVILQSGTVLLVMFASFYILPSPTLLTVGMSSMVTVAGSLLFHICLVPQLWDHLRYAQSELSRVSPSPSIKSRLASSSDEAANPLKPSLLSQAVTLMMVLPVAFQSRRLGPFTLDGMVPTNELFGDISNELYDQGESLGHGRLTPYRILFDGHKSNISMISLGGYDIVQLVVDELVGITLPDNDGEADDWYSSDKPDLESMQGSTHVGEAYTEVQHLIKDFVDMLRQFKERQQEEFDRHHQRRQEQDNWLQQQQDSNSQNIRCDYKFNSGIGATTYTGLSVLENSRIPQALYSAAKVCRGMEPRCPSEALHLLNKFEDETTSTDHLATYVDVVLGTDPFSENGAEWLRLARETIQRLQKDPRVLGGVEVHIDGYAASLEDFKSYQRRSLPGSLFLVIAILAVALFAAFGSVIVPIQVIMTTGLTMGTSMGVGVLVYRDGILNWTRLSAFSSLAKGDGVLPFSAVLSCIIVAVLGVISSTSLAHHQESYGTIAASGKAALCSASIFAVYGAIDGSDSLQWTLIVSVALLLDYFYTRKLWLTFRTLFTSKNMLWSTFGQKQRKEGQNILDIARRSCKNDDYLKKYEEFIRSPRAP